MVCVEPSVWYFYNQPTSNTNLAGSTKLVLNSFQRGVYPPEDFTTLGWVRIRILV
ncbi:unnamed protein product [Penicillium camemberti]|uniref:Str. FM013 n=1 Tax=Penicillium camemberti (strain FM 013) TaxID=1429867 RepID=A0A0G4PX65_PENC3|nr:unnamed protein product [Penicillium camemberti]